jgi:predicted PurR-regulated permease PerM
MSVAGSLPHWTIWAIVLAILVAAAVVFWPLIGVSILGASVAVLLFPIRRRLERRMRPAYAALILTVVVGVALVGAVAVTIAVLVQNIDYIAEIAQTILGAVAAPAADPFGGALPMDLSTLTAAIQEQLSALTDSVGSLLGEFGKASLELITFFLVLYLVLEQGEAVGRRLDEALPGEVRRLAGRLWAMAVDVIYSIYVVHFATAFLSFLVALPFFYILGYGHVLFFSILCGIFQLVPFLGQTVILLVLGGYAFAIGDWRGLLLIVFIGYPFVAAIPDWIMRPLLMGAKAQIHPVVMFIGFFGGITLLGVVGLLLGPLLLSLAVGAYGIVVEELEFRRDAALPPEPGPSPLEAAEEGADVLETAS